MAKWGQQIRYCDFIKACLDQEAAYTHTPQVCTLKMYPNSIVLQYWVSIHYLYT